MAATAVSVAADATVTVKPREEPAVTVTAPAPASSAATEPPASAATVRVLGTTSKVAETVAPAVTEPAGSAQGLSSGPSAHARPGGPDSVQPAKVWPAVATAVSTAVDRTLKEKLCEESAPTVATPAPATSAATEPLAPAATVRVLGTASKVAETVAPAVTEPTGSSQGSACAPDSHASSSGDVQPAKAQPSAATAVSVAADRTLKAKLCEESAPTVTASAPATSAATEPPAPVATVKAFMTTKAASARASAVTEPAGSMQGLTPVPAAQTDKPPDSVQPTKA